jgi:pSer/pThr/pTyr-binding forkhead associated (FHA) protein
MDVLLLILRLVAGALLLLFMAAVLVMLWRDFQAAALALGEPGRQRGRLVVVRGEGVRVGTAFTLLPLTSLGRAPTNTIVLNDTFCSQEHAWIMRRDGQWWLEDRGSSNGTRLNGERISEPVVLSSGDVIGIGRLELRFELE